MITSRSPLRISLGGGGTDLPSYYKKYNGYCISGSINKYVYTTIITPFSPGIYLKYSEIEKEKNFSKIKHKIIKNVLTREIKSLPPQIEIITLADIPSGTGLGSSGSFTVGLIKALRHYKKELITQKELAELSCKIEIEDLKNPSGKQDQYIATYGGITEFYFKKSGKVIVNRLPLKKNTIDDLNENLIMFFTGFSRNSSDVLKDQDIKTKKLNSEMIKNLNLIKKLGYESRDALIKNDIEKFGKIMHEHWNIKKERTAKISNTKINDYYDIAIKNGAIGGKLIGAGGGGFLLFVTDKKKKLRKKMNELGLLEVDFQFEFEGAKII